jgi:spoIIIJ-associated protein
MSHIPEAKEILESMISRLGFEARIEIEMTEDHGEALQVHMDDPEALVGAEAERLEDLQYLVNRLLQQVQQEAPRVKVDVAHFRERREEALVETVRAAADEVRATGIPAKLDPMNSYQRRVVHNMFVEDPEIKSWSPEDDSRLKRITLFRR